MKREANIALGLLLAAGSLFAETPDAPAADKSGYNLFQPVPDNLLRDFDTDRPDKTNSPHTLDAGHFQLEMDLLSYTRNKDQGVLSENQSWANANLRIGLTNWADLQFMVPLHEVNRDSGFGLPAPQRSNGIGDLTVALKTNFWGNDGGDNSGGMEFFVKTPTASHNLGNGKVEGGALVLLDTSLPHDFDLGYNTGVGISADDVGSGYHADIINTLSLSRTIVGPLSAYLEFATSVPTDHPSKWEGTVDVGVTLMVGKNLQFDTGINFGVTPAADDLQPFVGVSARF